MSDRRFSYESDEQPAEAVHGSRHDAAAEGEGAVIIGDRRDLHIGDYVGFERIAPTREWRLSLGKVVGFPTTHTVKVAHYDAVNDDTTVLDPAGEAALYERAVEEGTMEMWNDREALREQLAAATVEETEASRRLYARREATLQKQSSAADPVVQALEQLDSARLAIANVASRQWRDARTMSELSDDMKSIIRALMLVLHEDRASSLMAMQDIMRQGDFMDRIMEWDCTITPMSLARRQKILELGNPAGAELPKKKRTSRRRRSSAAAAATTILACGEDVGALAGLDEAIRSYVNAQLICSAAGTAQARALDECFNEQQDQRAALREVNDMRADISQIEERMLSLRKAIMGIEDGPKAILPLEAHRIDTTFYKRVYPDGEGRFVQEVILREAVLVNFGPLATEDTDGYVNLNKGQVDHLHMVVRQANIRHDADEMEELLARKEREEAELGEIRARIAELRGKQYLSADEAEELPQLEKYLEEAERRHRATLSRIADLYACGRGARGIAMATKRQDFKYSRLHCKMAGDWEEILNHPEHYEQMIAALRSDLSVALHLPVEYIMDIDARCGSLIIDFTVKHSGELDDEELQELVNNGEFPSLCMFYERVTFKKTSPINTPEQEEAFLRSFAQRLPISGVAVKERLEDYYNADGTLSEEFSEETQSSPDYQPARITIFPVREDYEEYVLLQPVVLYGLADSALPDPSKAALFAAATAAKAPATDAADGDQGLTVEEQTGSVPATAMKSRGVGDSPTNVSPDVMHQSEELSSQRRPSHKHDSDNESL